MGVSDSRVQWTSFFFVRRQCTRVSRRNEGRRAVRSDRRSRQVHYCLHS